MLAVEPALSTWLPPMLMLIGVSFLGVIMALAVRNHRQAAARDRALTELTKSETRTRQDQSSTDRDRVGVDMPTLPAELLTSAQRLASTLDHKSHQIEELLAAADHRIAELTALLEQAGVAVPHHHETTAELAVSIEAKTAMLQKTSVARDMTPARSIDPLSQAVYRLADAGRKPVEIARELHEQTGKIELILALRGC